MTPLLRLIVVAGLTAMSSCTWDSELASISKPRRVRLVQHHEAVPGMGSSSENCYLELDGFPRTLAPCNPRVEVAPEGTRVAVESSPGYWSLYWLRSDGGVETGSWDKSRLDWQSIGR